MKKPCINIDELRAKRAAQGDKLKDLPKRVRQAYRGIDFYQCTNCGKSGPPWAWVTEDGKNLDDLPDDVLIGMCPCGGTLYLLD